LEQCARVQRNRRGRDTIEVYAIRAGDFVKIGLARDARQRLGELQTSNPLRLSLIFTVHVAGECALAVERAAHRHAKNHHVSGEWFSLTDNQARKFIRRAVRSIQEMERLNSEPSPADEAPVQAQRHESAAQRKTSRAERREASKATFAAVRERFMKRRQTTG
jgi:hypothetical protein